MSESIEIRDTRRKQFFMVDDAYLNGYARLCGVNATCVYMSLCRHSNKEQTSWPSIELIQRELDIGSHNTIRNAIKKLEEWGIIRVERSRDPETKRQNVNRYILVDKASWVPKPVSPNDSGPMSPFDTRAGVISRHDPVSFHDIKPVSPNDMEGNTVIEVNTVEGTPYSPPGGDEVVKNKPTNSADLFSGKMTDNDFAIFWEEYPRHEVPKTAKEKFKKLDRVLLPTILKAIQNQKMTAQWQNENGKFIPMPTTWINQKRWESEVKVLSPEDVQEQIYINAAKESLRIWNGDWDQAAFEFDKYGFPNSCDLWMRVSRLIGRKSWFDLGY